ncbi:MAG: leucyl/phenylalanyl-tRNA--protein transferase [Acidobacteria bacterium]|nr:leucyl/phenylalanyl-tRNA--protein transferase [Acidobacteriota bacterium]MCA1651080.1 leucyl/phenylalanyl-tRNA--protein transferase [Acidobacteriota bacterium]
MTDAARYSCCVEGLRRHDNMIPSDVLVSAYVSGWFPMAIEKGDIRWYSPDPRGIVPLESFHIPARLARVVRRGTFRIAIDTAFERVIRACAESERDREDPGSWIDEAIIESYVALHGLGLAHSVEAWRGDQLAGGLYGVALGGAFFGESMFHHQTDASKVALAALLDRLRARGYRLLDTQWLTDHLVQFGAIEVPRRRYLSMLDESLKIDCGFR